MPSVWDSRIDYYAKKNGVDSSLVKVFVQQESTGNPSAVSPDSAYGLGQMILPTARYYKPDITAEELKDPEINLDLTTRHLADLNIVCASVYFLV